MIEPFLTSLGLTKGATIGGFLGALVSLKWVSGLSLWQGASTLFCGMLVASYVGPLATGLLALSDKQEGAISFLVGVFGMASGAALVKAIPGLIEDIRSRVRGGP